MLSYDDALHHILHHPNIIPTITTLPLSEARGFVLASDIGATTNLPAFDNSMVDGFAIGGNVTSKATIDTPLVLPITQQIRAGGTMPRPLRPAEAAQIFTGAPVPEGTYGMVMVEDTELEDTESGTFVSLREPANPKFIRKMGSDIAVGQLALSEGSVIGVGEIGLLAALNWHTILVCAKPRVGLLTTGDEIVAPSDAPLQPGQIRDANGPALRAAIEEAGGVVALQIHAQDSPESVREAFTQLQAAGCQVIISSGGVSMGEHDYVKVILEEQGTLDFWRVAIKPGKPLAFGTLRNALFFGLPGNPASSLVTFELFIRPVLRKVAGQKEILRPQITVALTQNIPHETGRREFVRCGVKEESGVFYATPTGSQGSHRLSSMIGVEGLLICHEDHGDYEKNARATLLWLR
jgi:molybdopterin molybdotransferase